MPEMIRFRWVKRPGNGICRIGISETSAPERGERAGEVLVLGRIDRGKPVGQHGDRSAPRAERTAVGRGVDAPRQARDDREPGPSQRAGQPFRHPLSVRRAAPRPDQGDRQLVLGFDRSLHVEQDGRVGDVFERRRILAVAAGDDR